MIACSLRRALRPFRVVALLAVVALTACQILPGNQAPKPVARAPAVAPPTKTLPTAKTIPPTAATAPRLAPPSGPAPVDIGFLVPLSGPGAALGHALLQAAELAVSDSGNANLTLLPRDTQGTAAGAATAANSALAAGAEIILGPLFATSVSAVAPLAAARSVPVIAFSNDRAIAGNGVYIMGFTPKEQIARVVGYARSRGLSRFAALAPNTAYGNAVIAALRASVAKDGGSVTKLVSYPEGTTSTNDLSPIVKAFTAYETRHDALLAEKAKLAHRDDAFSKAALQRLDGVDAIGDIGYDAVVLPEGGLTLKTLAALLVYYDLDPTKTQLLGSGQWDVPGLGHTHGLIGGWFAGSPPNLELAFQKRFTGTFAYQPPRLASLGYDAVALAAALVRSDPAQPFTASAITNPNGFSGYDGIFRFGTESAAQYGLAVLQVEPSGFKVIDPAPTSFQALGE